MPTTKITYHEPPKIHKKDPNEIVTYEIDWSNWLKGDTISTSDWLTLESSVSGITEDSSSNTDTTTTITLSGGSDGAKYSLTNQIVTAAGLKKERVLIVRVMDTEFRRLSN